MLTTELGNQHKVGEALGGYSQATISLAILYDKVGPGLADALLRYRGCTMEELLQRHGLASGKMQRLEYRMLPGWEAAAEQARATRRVRWYAINEVGRWPLDYPHPYKAEEIDAAYILRLAQIWMDFAPQDVINEYERIDAELRERSEEPAARPGAHPPGRNERLRSDTHPAKKPHK